MGLKFDFTNSRVYYLAFAAYWGILLFGYDTGIAGGVVGQNYFQQQFGLWPGGKKDLKRVNEVSSNVVAVLQGGAFFGALGSAPISARLGRRWTLVLFSCIFMLGAILTTIPNGTSRGLNFFYGGRVVCGLGIGGISAVAPTYVSEVCPKDVRGRITGMFQIMVATGVMISYFVNYGVANGPHRYTHLVWQLPFGLQMVPLGIMLLGLMTVRESPRWLASVGRTQQAAENLAYLRKRTTDDPVLLAELAEIEEAIEEERAAREGLGAKEAFLGKGNWIRFVIAIVIFALQQWSGQNSVGYYAPQIFTSIGYTGPKNSLLASGVYGVIKVVATAVFIFGFVESLGRKLSLLISAVGMGTLFFIIAALLKSFPPGGLPEGADPPPASKAMAAMLFIYVCFYSLGWGPLPWVYCSDIFPTRTRHYGLATASASQWFFNFIVSKFTPQMITALGWKIFLMFATINIGGMAVFSALIPETKGRSLEEMDVIFGSVDANTRAEGIARRERALDAAAGIETGSMRSEREKV